MSRLGLLFGFLFSSILWLVGGAFLWASYTQAGEARHLGQGKTPLASLKPGDEFRLQARLQNPDTETSPHHQKKCAAFRFRVYEVSREVIRSSEEGEEDEEKIQHHQVLEKKQSPPQLDFATEDGMHIKVAQESWQPSSPAFELTEEDRPYLAELPRPQPHFWYYEFEEATLHQGAEYSLIGKVHKVSPQELVAQASQVSVLSGSFQQLSQERGQESQMLLRIGLGMLAAGAVTGAFVYFLVSRLTGNQEKASS